MKPADCKKIYTRALEYDAKTGHLLDDVPFYLKLIKKYGGPVLELACGTGRVTIPIAEKGYNITGLDISKEMIALGKKKAAEKDVEINWIQGDVRDFNLHKKFKFIFYPFNSILHLHYNEAFYACFNCVRKHLVGDGRFAFEIFMPSLTILGRDPEKFYKRTGLSGYTDPITGYKVRIDERTAYDRATQLLHITWKYKSKGGQRPDDHFSLRILFPQEINAMLEHCGLEIEAKYGNYELSPFKSDSAKQIILCRKK